MDSGLTDAGVWSWLGAALLVAGGVGWGRQVSGVGVTGATLALIAVLSAAGLVLVARAFLAGDDLPLILGVVGALAGATLMIFTRRE